MNVVPFSGWTLERIVNLDQALPGLAGHMLRASAERRQVIAAFLSVSQPASDFQSEAEVGWFLCHGSHDAILRGAFGTVPHGMRGALGRSGFQPHPRRFYGYLRALLSRSDDQAMIRVIARLKSIDLDQVRILRALPRDLRHEKLVAELIDVADARMLREFVDFMAERGVDRQALIDAFIAAPSRDAYVGVARRWSLRGDLPEHPVPRSDDYRPITSGDELRQVAQRFRNCMRSYVPNIFEGRSSFALFKHGDNEAVVHLVRRSGDWQLDDVYGHDVRPLNPLLERAAERYLQRHGIGTRRQADARQALDSLRRITRYNDPERFNF